VVLERGPAGRTPLPNPRFAQPVSPAPWVGYAPQASGPLPAYPGFPSGVGGQTGYPSQAVGAGAMAQLYTDLKASRAGDVLTIVVTQQAVANASGARTVARDFGIDFQKGTGFLSFLPDGGIEGGASTTGRREQNGSFTMATRFTVTVAEVLPNGNLLVQGSQQVMMDGKPQSVKLVGEVRPYDVSAGNTIESTKVANVHIEFDGLQSNRGKTVLDMLARAVERLFGIFF
jgi:flagellar L-ring protein precursor FlgH